MIINYFDAERHGGLLYKEFMEVLLPCDDLNLRAVVAQRPVYSCMRYERLD